MDNSNSQDIILKIAKKEFLEKGFKNASLRNIANKSGFTTGAIYGYFTDKETLFDSIVKNQADFFYFEFSKMQDEYSRLSVEKQLEHFSEASEIDSYEFTDYIKNNADIFKLIVFRSIGTKYENFVEDLIKIEEEYTYKFIDNLISNGYSVNKPDKMLVHILTSALYYGVFEVVEHDISREKSIEYLTNIKSFYSSGWKSLLNVRKTD